MAVRAVTPRVVAISGHVDIYRDADGVDAWKDGWATGEDIYDPEYLPPQRHGRPFLPLTDLVTGELCTASPRVESQSRVHASSPTQTGCDGRGSAPSSSTSVEEHPGALGGGPDSSPNGPSTRHPALGAGTTPFEDVARPVRSPDAP